MGVKTKTTTEDFSSCVGIFDKTLEIISQKWRNSEPMAENFWKKVIYTKYAIHTRTTIGEGKLSEDTFQCIQKCPSPFH